jgi:16S rRNA (guanine1516-N2)-methyltransferase
MVDPMHPPRKKLALVKSQMRLIREIVGEDPDQIDLVKVALQTARKRVVLKWPRRADTLDGIPPYSHQIIGKTTRYDVFMVDPMNYS